MLLLLVQPPWPAPIVPSTMLPLGASSLPLSSSLCHLFVPLFWPLPLRHLSFALRNKWPCMCVQGAAPFSLHPDVASPLTLWTFLLLARLASSSLSAFPLLCVPSFSSHGHRVQRVRWLQIWSQRFPKALPVKSLQSCLIRETGFDCEGESYWLLSLCSLWAYSRARSFMGRASRLITS